MCSMASLNTRVISIAVTVIWLDDFLGVWPTLSLDYTVINNEYNKFLFNAHH